jgi:hypothetical protein
MRPRLIALGLLALAVVAFTAGPARAVTANGPYYSMPAWDQTLPASTRFIVLSNMASAAVLDRETGLVWELAPSTTAIPWVNAFSRCVSLAIGSRMGWRLPTIQELASLIDKSTPFPGPSLPVGHPFVLTTPNLIFWSSTTLAINADFAYASEFHAGETPFFDKALSNFVWCVRGGVGLEVR